MAQIAQNSHQSFLPFTTKKSKKTILLTRPEPFASAMISKLEALGFLCQRFPLTQHVSLPFKSFEKNAYVLIATSATTFLFLQETQIEPIKQYPLLCVGEKTKIAAENLNFQGKILTYPNVQDLTKNLTSLSPKQFLYLAGKVRRGFLEAALLTSYHQLKIVEIYDTIPTQLALRYNKKLDYDIIILMSAFCCFLFNQLEGLMLPHTKILCFSERIFEYLSPSLRKRTFITQESNENAIYDALKNL